MKQLARRLLGVFMAMMMLLTALPSAFALESDIKGHWAEEALQSFADDGYLAGDGRGHYTPNGVMTRAQFATIMNRVVGLTEESSAISGYTDIKTSDWYYHELAKALAAGYMSGTSQTTMSPNAAVTRQQAFTMLARYLGLNTSSDAALNGFADEKSVAAYARGPVAAMINAGYVAGTADKKINPEKQLTRAEGVTVLYRAKAALKAVVPSAASALKDGIYEGEAAGYSGTTRVRVTVSGGKISAVEVVSHGDSSSYFSRAKAVIDKVINKQSTDVDTVSNATYSSWGILNAINNALKGAGDDAPITMEVASWKELTAALGKAKDGDTIKLTRDITDAGQVDAVSSATATINKAVTIDGNSKTISAYKDGKVTKNITGKDGNVTATEQVDATFCFDVTTASGIQIEDLTINGASFNRKLGGAMYVETGVELTLNNVTFRNCAAGNTGAGNGGAAIYAQSHKGTAPVVTANNCTFKNNTVNGGNTGRGGAVYGYNANITLNNCTFTGNKAAYGGAVTAAGSTELTVKGCTFDANNDAVYGGDDIYIFDGYTFYKKTKAADSAVTAVLSGNTHKGNDGNDFKDYRVVCGRVLGDVTDTTSSAGNTITKTCSGSGAPFLYGHDLTFSSTDYDRKGAPV